MSSPHCFASAKPGRSHGTQAAVSPYTCFISFGPSFDVHRAMIASGCMWSTCAWSMKAWINASIDGRFAFRSTRQWARYSTISSSLMARRARRERTGASSTPGKPDRVIVRRSVPLPFTLRTFTSSPRKFFSTIFAEVFPPAQFVTEASSPRMLDR